MFSMLTKKGLFIILPILLILTTSFVFYVATKSLGKYWGYLLGFAFYYIIWCILIPLYTSKRSFFSFFRNERPLFRKKNWWILILFASTILVPIFMYFIPKLPSMIPAIIILAIPLSIIHGYCEELFWRGLYIKVFPKSILWSVFIPSIFFTLWHIAPQFSIQSDHPVIFIISTFPLGVTYSIVTFVTNSAKWSARGHTISGFLAFSLPISLCLYKVIVS